MACKRRKPTEIVIQTGITPNSIVETRTLTENKRDKVWKRVYWRRVGEGGKGYK